MQKKLVWILSYLTTISVTVSTAQVNESVEIRVDWAEKSWTVSEYLTGSHFVYAFENDNLYRDNRIRRWMKDSNVRIIRWPGGTAVCHYHWNDLNGIPFKADTWMPDYSAGYKDPNGYMDLDEFIAYCRSVGAEPMVGVNPHSGVIYDREEESLAEAEALIRYCKDKEYNVKFWYIGNEGYANWLGPKIYPEYIDRYARVLKQVDPNIIIVGDWKFGPEEKNRYEELLQIIDRSTQIDVIEVHEKWGSEWGLKSPNTFEEWQAEPSPFYGRMNAYIERFHHDMQTRGRDVRLSMNEWGLGNTKATPFQNGLIAADYLISIVAGNLFTACYWNLNIGGGNTRILQTVNKGRELSQISPIGDIFRMYAHVGGKEFLHLSTSDEKLYGFAVKSEEKGVVELYVLNKNPDARRCTVIIDHFAPVKSPICLESYAEPGGIRSSKIRLSGKEVSVSVPAFSFNRIVLCKE